MNNGKQIPGYVKSARFFTSPFYPGKIKIVIRSVESAKDGILVGQKLSCHELYNTIEPFDFHIHVFLVPTGYLIDGETLRYSFRNRYRKSVYFEALGDPGYDTVVYDAASVCPEEDLLPACDSGIREISRTVTPVAEGIESVAVIGTDAKGQPMRWFFLKIAHGAGTFAAGTPHDGYDVGNVIQTVEGQALAARENGKNVVAALNADFFDMFGDCRPSGPCIKNGRVVCNGDSDRQFFGMKADGTPVLGDPKADPSCKTDLREAVGGFCMILKDEKPFEVWPGEPFCADRHPRTAVGLTAEKDVIFLITDGRIPDWSNGTTLYDTALLLKNEGAENGLNLDGGGSCTLLLWQDGKFVLQNKPADLVRPDAALIREIFDSVQIVARSGS